VTDAQRMLVLLRRAGSLGLHTHDLRAAGVSGNPSQRAADLEAKGHRIRRVRENRGKRPGSRFFLEPAGIGSSTPGTSPGTTPGEVAAVDPNGRGRTELVLSYVPGERRVWWRTHCPPEDIEALQTVDEALAEQFGAAS
jgi:hypothetical protein